MSTIADWLARHGDLERQERELLVCAAGGFTRARLITDPDTTLCEETQSRLADWVARRRAGEPVAYLLERQGFLDFDLRVTPAVLIPRPETEVLVEQAIAGLGRHLQCAEQPGPGASPSRQAEPLRLLDLGTGSGAIALALANAFPGAEVVGADKSPDALAIAAANANALGLKVLWLESDWCSAVNGAFDLIVSNPPYIAVNDPHLEHLSYEPALALLGGADGLDAFRTIILEAPSHLHTGGVLAFEHGYDQADAVAHLLRSRGFEQIETYPDLAGIPRVTLARWGQREAD
ncbi:MAG: peptide chain release factor N(5)-glutamine methyltransferase [Pseudomonadales bacterium]